MDQLSEARLRKFAHKVDEAGWVRDSGASHFGTGTGFWLYSYNLKTGPRGMGQLTLEGYRAMHSGAIRNDLRSVEETVEVLGSTLAAYDELRSDELSRKTSEVLIAALAAYFSYTKTFQTLPAIAEHPNQHVVVFDWMTFSVGRVLRPAAVIGDTLLSPAELQAFAQKVLAVHLAKHPNERPI